MILTRPTLIIALSTLASLSPINAKDTILTSTDGKTLKVKMTGFKDDTVEVLSLSNRKTYNIPLNKLDEESQEIVNEWTKEGGHLSTRFDIDYTSGKTDRLEDANDYDDRLLELSPRFTVTNDFGNTSTRPVKMVTLILGRPVLERRKISILAKEEFDVPSIKPQKSSTFALKKLEVKYDDNQSAQYGSKYIGYAVFLISNDEAVYSKYTPATVKTKFGETLLEAEKGDNLNPN